jgi:hypothetical protein
MSALKDALMSDEQYRYEHDQIMGDYVFRKGDRVLFRATSLAVCYSEDTHMFGIPGEPIYTLLKHGNSQYVLEHARKLQTAYRDAGLPGMASDVIVILSDFWDVKTLNKIISTTGYLGRFIQEQSSRSDPNPAEMTSGESKADRS